MTKDQIRLGSPRFRNVGALASALAPVVPLVLLVVLTARSAQTGARDLVTLILVVAAGAVFALLTFYVVWFAHPMREAHIRRHVPDLVQTIPVIASVDAVESIQADSGLDPRPKFAPEFPPIPLSLAVTRDGLQIWAGRVSYRLVWWRPWSWLGEVEFDWNKTGLGYTDRALRIPAINPNLPGHSAILKLTVTGGPLGVVPSSERQVGRAVAVIEHARASGGAPK